jgi:hypothetical protein
VGCWWPVDFEFSLASNLIDRRLIGELRDELIGLNVDVLLAWWGLWRLHIASEELLSGLGSLLFEAFWVVLSLVCLEKLVWVSPCWNHHSCIGGPTEHSLIISDVLREVSICIGLTIWILILGFLWNDAGMGSETWR